MEHMATFILKIKMEHRATFILNKYYKKCIINSIQLIVDVTLQV